MRPSACTAAALLAAALALAGAAQGAVPAVSSSSIYSLALSDDGRVFSWGWDLSGALGQGRPLYGASVRKVGGLPTIVHMDVGPNHAAAVDSEGHVWTWGRDNWGQMGRRTSPRWSKPARMIGINGAVQVAAGESFTAIRRGDGTVLALGGYLGEPGIPKVIQGLAGVTDIRARGFHLLALKGDAVWALGRNEMGQLGDGTTVDRFTAQPVSLPGPVTRIAASRFGSLALGADGTVYRWGQQCSGTQLTPLAIAGLTPDVVDIASSNTTIYAVRSTGQAYLLSGACNSPLTAFTNITHLAADIDTVVARRGDGQVVVTGGNYEGQHGLGTTTIVPGQTVVPGLVSVVSVAAAAGFVTGNATLFALTASGDIYAWGSNAEGKLGLDDDMVASVPERVGGLPVISKIAAGPRTAVALDVAGEVWAWGNNHGDMFNLGTWTPSSEPVKIAGLPGVMTEVAAGETFLLLLRSDGTVWIRGMFLGVVYATTQVPGLTGIVKVAAAGINAWAIDNTGKVFAWGSGGQGLIGDGQMLDRTTPVPLTAFGASIVTAISANELHALARTQDGTVWSWGANTPALGDPGFAQPHRTTPAPVAGIAGAVDVLAGKTHSLARLASGQVSSWGSAALGDGPVTVRSTPGPVRTISSVRAIAAGYHASFAIGPDGLAYGWGGPRSDTLALPIGDGTFAFRDSPALVLRDGARGNLDSDNWHLDLDANVPNAPPAQVVRAIVPVTTASVSEAAVSLSAAINFRGLDVGRKVGTYIIGVVPPTFLGQAQLAASMSAKRIEALQKAGAPVLVQLTPSGWTTVDGQLVAYSTSVVAGNGAATNILNGTPLASIPGAQFCVGYGETAGSMLSSAALVDVLSLAGAASSASGLPCVPTGVYLDGPATSIAGSAVSFNASVVGFGPTGSVQFRDNVANLGAPAALGAASEAVGRASVATSSLGAGPHSIAASYSGDAQNPAAESAIPLAHQVNAAAPGSASVALAGAVSSEAGVEAVFSVLVTGNNPTGTVQFMDGATNLGAAEALVGGTATLRISTLALGAHSVTASYSGDSNNTAATSNALAHTVYGTITTGVALASSANPAAYGSAVTLTATVAGNAPTGSVTFQEGATTLATVSLSGAGASTAVSGLSPGVHVITATYSGDGANQAVTSPALFQEVAAQTASTAPNPFAFAAIANVAPGSTQTSNAIVVSGLGVAAPIVVAGGEYSIGCGAAFTSAAGTITNGQSVCVRHTASGSNSTATYTTLTIGGVSATFTSTTYSSTFLAGVSSLVSHYYQSILRRAPDAGGKAFWEGEALRVSGLGASVNEALYSLSATFYVSAEYAAFNRDNTGFVTDLYNTFFSRAPDSGGLAYWAGQLDQGLPREVALASFMFSAEFAAFTQALFGANPVRAEVDAVTDFYRGLLARLPDDGGLNFWVGRFRTAQCQGREAVIAQVEAISSAFTLSGEYAARARSNAQYVGDLYNAFLRRGGDLGGVQYWINQIAGGFRTREQVRIEFKNSPEFQGRVNAIIQQGCL